MRGAVIQKKISIRIRRSVFEVRSQEDIKAQFSVHETKPGDAEEEAKGARRILAGYDKATNDGSSKSLNMV
ncbi:hypothetical protein PT974_00108 [Cladobotryum mycophilum]|uniref:Uncharacterized protein n=1 Tax=Cladobotryum mycophilum TaxID=491253 RepID=A0ABR0SZW0_9HYPO